MVAPITFRPEFHQAVRENTPLRIGIAGPTKSGKTYSAHRLARGLVPPGGGPILMINAEGPVGHQYADKFKYRTCELTAPYRPMHYTESLKHAASLGPGCVLIDSTSHMQDGPGGIVEWHTEIALRMAKGDADKIEKMNAPAWVEPKAMENQFVYQLQTMACPVILCFRAKEKVKITKEGKWIDLGWQPIASDRVAFETLFTLMLPPHSKGVPDLAISDLREPFDTLIPKGKQIDEDLGRMLVEWARGQAAAAAAALVATLLEEIQATLVSRYPRQTAADKESKSVLLEQAFGTRGWSKVQAMDEPTLRAGIAKLRQPVEVTTQERVGSPAAGEIGHAGSGSPAPGKSTGEAKGDSGAPPAATPEDPGLFPTAQALKPPRQPDPPAGLAGVDVPDEAQSLEQQIEAEKAKLERQPPDEIWAKLCESITGTTVLDMADPEALQKLLEIVKGLVAEDPDTIEKVTAIVSAA
jgi:hypothetical protein